MKPEQQRIAIGEACGWKLVTDNPEYEPYWEDPKGNMVSVNNGVHRFPDYLNDLNAMHEAEKLLNPILAAGYAKTLTSTAWESEQPVFAPMTATAAQRAEAFLHTIGKWTINPNEL
jgi:hypothetical protein